MLWWEKCIRHTHSTDIRMLVKRLFQWIFFTQLACIKSEICHSVNEIRRCRSCHPRDTQKCTSSFAHYRVVRGLHKGCDGDALPVHRRLLTCLLERTTVTQSDACRLSWFPVFYAQTEIQKVIRLATLVSSWTRSTRKTWKTVLLFLLWVQ